MKTMGRGVAGMSEAEFDWQREESDVYGITPSGHIVELDDAPENASPLWVQRRPVTWNEELKITSTAGGGDGFDLERLFRFLVDRTVRDSNFLGHIDPTSVQDRKLGWHLFDLVGCLEFVERVKRQDGLEEVVDVEGLKKSSGGSPGDAR